MQALPLLLSLTLVGVGSDSPNKDCGSPNAQLLNVTFVPPCEKQACILTRGELITVTAIFVPKIASRNVFVTAYQTEPYFNAETLVIQGENMCGKHNITCPLEPNRPQYAVVKEIVPRNLPLHKTAFRVIFTADNDKRLFCGTCPIEVR